MSGTTCPPTSPVTPRSTRTLFHLDRFARRPAATLIQITHPVKPACETRRPADRRNPLARTGRTLSLNPAAASVVRHSVTKCSVHTPEGYCHARHRIRNSCLFGRRGARCGTSNCVSISVPPPFPVFWLRRQRASEVESTPECLAGPKSRAIVKVSCTERDVGFARYDAAAR